ncbi:MULTISPECIES: hypothetical protein [Pseudomonas]|uniref:hypothetical protein n=1 Tax=Pseudomonas TaxID=286 RepID=UPI00301DF86B
MDRTTFLAQPDVNGFIEWLQATLGHLQVHLRLRRSKQVRGGLDLQVVGLEQVHAAYRWGAGWQDYQTGKWVASTDWVSTKASLDLLRSRLASALASGCDDATYKACRAVLQWGGVWGAVPFLGELRRKGKLVEYLNACRPLFSLDTDQKLSDLSERSIQRFDAGLTKIHALIDTTGSPIYDSRVGAAIAMLYARYRENAQGRAQLKFPSGAARGKQIRDPGELGYAAAPRFFTSKVTDHIWARSQVELGWIIQAVLARLPGMFSGSLAERSHCFEAALFMIGYDLRCLVPDADVIAVPGDAVKAGKRTRRLRGTWVQPSTVFPQVFWDYLECSQGAGYSVELSDFRQWQVQVKGREPSTARDYATAFKHSELDIVRFSLPQIEAIANGGAKGLEVLSGGIPEFIAGDEYEQVYLVNVYLSGRATEMAREHSVPAAELILRAGFAGKQSTAKLILRLGRTLGEHFDLIANGHPTELFETFFGQTLTDLDDQLFKALECIGVTGAVAQDPEYSPAFAALIHEAAAGEFIELEDGDLDALIESYRE